MPAGYAIRAVHAKTLGILEGYLHNWDVSNRFAMGGSAFHQNSGYCSTGTVAAVAIDRRPITCVEYRSCLVGKLPLLCSRLSRRLPFVLLVFSVLMQRNLEWTNSCGCDFCAV